MSSDRLFQKLIDDTQHEKKPLLPKSSQDKPQETKSTNPTQQSLQQFVQESLQKSLLDLAEFCKKKSDNMLAILKRKIRINIQNGASVDQVKTALKDIKDGESYLEAVADDSLTPKTNPFPAFFANVYKAKINAFESNLKSLSDLEKKELSTAVNKYKLHGGKETDLNSETIKLVNSLQKTADILGLNDLFTGLKFH